VADDALPRIRPWRDGGAILLLGPMERQLLGELLDRLDDRLGTDDPTTVRLFPPAHQHDPDAEAEYRALVGEDLLDGRRDSLAVVRETLDAPTLDAAQVSSWLGVINDLRLVLGTELDVTPETPDDPPDEDDPAYRLWVEYLYLTWIEGQLVEVASAALPDLGTA
jgi:hypothetical protein